MKTREEKLLDRITCKIKKIRRKQLEELARSHADVVNHIKMAHDIGLNIDDDLNLDFGHHALFRIDQETGECVDYLMYFDSANDIWYTKKYLEAYLTTNRDVLDTADIDRLEKLIKRYW